MAAIRANLRNASGITKPRRVGMGGAPQLAQVGTTEHAVLVLVIVEMAALVFIRKHFKSAHGG